MNFNVYYEYLATNARIKQGIDQNYQNSIKHATASAAFTSRYGDLIALMLGEGNEILQILTGHDSLAESFKDSFNNHIGAAAQNYLSNYFPRASDETRATAMGILAKEGLLANNSQEAEALLAGENAR